MVSDDSSNGSWAPAGPRTVLIVTMDSTLNERLRGALPETKYQVVVRTTYDGAKQRFIDGPPPDLLIAAVRLGAFNALHLVERAQNRGADTRTIIVGDVDDRPLRPDVQAIGAAWLDYPVSVSTFRSLVEHLVSTAAV